MSFQIFLYIVFFYDDDDCVQQQLTKVFNNKQSMLYLLPIPGGPDNNAAFHGPPLGLLNVLFAFLELLNTFSHVRNQSCNFFTFVLLPKISRV